MTALRSRTYLDGSRGAPCTLRIPGVCRDERETTVAAHIRDNHKGAATKASDLSVADACDACHMVFDRQRRLPNGFLLSPEEWNFYALRGLQETLERRKDMGLLVVAGDAEAKPRREPKAKARKVGASRPIPHRKQPIPAHVGGIPSRPFPKKAST